MVFYERLEDSFFRFGKEVVAVVIVAYLSLTVPRPWISWPSSQSRLHRAAYKNKFRVCPSFCFSSGLEQQGARLEKALQTWVFCSVSKWAHRAELRKAVSGEKQKFICEGERGAMERTRNPKKTPTGSWFLGQHPRYPPGRLQANVGPLWDSFSSSVKWKKYIGSFREILAFI